MAATPAAPSRRAKSFFDDVIDEYGIREGDRVRIPMRQCELAQRKQVAASTIGSYLTSLGTAVVSRYPEIVICLTAESVRHDCRPSTVAIVDESGGELLAAYASLVRAQARVIELLANPSTDPREERAVPRADREELPELQRKNGQEDPSSPASFENGNETIRIFGELREEQVEHGGGLDAVLEPLHVAAERWRLKPMNNRAGLQRALGGFTLPEISHAVHRLCALIETGHTPVISPFGLLVQWARSGDTSHFAAVRDRRPAPVTTGQACVVPDEPESDFDADDMAAVLAMEADPDSFDAELDQLDRLVVATYPHLATHGIRPAMRHALRAAVFSDWVNGREHTTGAPGGDPANTTSPPPALRHQTAGTPQAHPQHTDGSPVAHRWDAARTAGGVLTATQRITNGAAQ
ncbi:MAG: hypothetical protein ACK5CE_03865 [Actinomycetes bacterium]|nr:hypothetical protein [Actinomycetota bacterium]